MTTHSEQFPPDWLDADKVELGPFPRIIDSNTSRKLLVLWASAGVREAKQELARRRLKPLRTR